MKTLYPFTPRVARKKFAESVNILFILLLMLYSPALLAQFGTLKGKVIDKYSREYLAFVSIILTKDSVEVKRAISDIDGNYLLKPAEPGTYNLKASYVGYKTLVINEIEIKNDRITYYDIELDHQVAMLEETVITSYKIPFIDKDRTTSGGRVSASEIRSVGYGSKSKSKGSSRTRHVYESEDVSSSGSKSRNRKYKPGQLTAGEINDFSKWELWKDISGQELNMYRDTWEITPDHRYCVQVMNSEGFPVTNCKVILLDERNEAHWTTITDNTGKAELWAGLFVNDSTQQGNYKILVEHEGLFKEINKPHLFKKGINSITIDKPCHRPEEVDILFTVDATGSMSDEIEYLKAELYDIIEKFAAQNSELQIRLGSVFYRDDGDEYVTRKSDFSAGPNQTIAFIKQQQANGGGDFPEAVDKALDVSVNQLNWSDNARAKLMFLILDAPPHESPKHIKKVHQAITAAAARGIRIIPVTASGIDKSTEYLMRCMALATNGTYVFLTDDSGIGGKHIKPSIDDYTVELLNDLIARLLDQYTQIETCPEKEQAPVDTLLTDTSSHVSVDPDSLDTKKIPVKKKDKLWVYAYPNPTRGKITITCGKKVKEVFVADISGKILLRLPNRAHNKIVADLSHFPNGMYLLKFAHEDHWAYSKVILQH